jgi:PKD repeat protein
MGANPGEVMVGYSIALSAAAHDSDARPAALTYAWVATSGMLAGATTPNPALTCTTVGTSTVTLTVSDGDCT